jgi:hypothetical protein
MEVWMLIDRVYQRQSEQEILIKFFVKLLYCGYCADIG